ncbi:hypothetical protein SAY86_019426 [Trapa natans]|uniref:RING-type domain-containing protein n=1 Tax=Trapa natans TaxID=22666 RepID=A0AAN7LXT1_TRANT|nr:hypothetical protein SAY86_019426 [Trapa natans]
MAVCKCRKATKLYCYVHRVPVCGECICFSEHQICVARTYSEWVRDGEYDWPPTCCFCQAVLEDGNTVRTTRLGCLHVIHTNCLVSHIKSFPSHTAPAGYTCPACSVPLWPPKSIKDSGSQLHRLLKEAISQTGLENYLFGNHTVDRTHAAPGVGESSITSLPSDSGGVESSKLAESEMVEIDVPGSSNYMRSSSPPRATTRKGPLQVDRQYSDISYYADDEDGNRKKYNRRGPVHHKFMKSLLPFWSNALPTLPVTAPPRKDPSNSTDAPEGRLWHKRSSRMDPRKILLLIAIMACLAMMAVLYYRIAQRGFGVELPAEEQ